jgi:hypothetical protein
MENLSGEFSNLLDESQNHLSDNTISDYINSFSSLTRKETRFIENHINSCNECSSRFNLLFDENFESGQNRKKIEITPEKLSAEDSDYKKFAETESGIEFSIRKENSDLVLIFLRTGKELQNCNCRLSNPEIGTIIRIVSLEAGKKYKIPAFSADIFSTIPFEIDYIKSPLSEVPYKRQSNKIFWTVAIISVAIIAAVTLFYLLSPSQPDQRLTKKTQLNAETTDKNIPEIHDTLLNEQIKKIPVPIPPEFAINYTLENSLNRNLRSASQLKLITPPAGDTVRTHLHFKWTPVEDVTEYYIEIVDNKNRLIWEKLVDYNEVTFLEKIDPGLYYFKVNAGSGFIVVGKFFIK